MNLLELTENPKLGLRVLTGGSEREVKGCYISDLLSDVMAHAEEGELWITLQTHQNIAAVATLRNLAGIIITNNRMPEKETIQKAMDEGVTILATPHSTFEIGGMLYQLLRC